MKKTVIWIAALGLAGGCVSPAQFHPRGTAGGTKQVSGPPIVIAAPLAEILAGETLDYQIYYFGTPVATATLTTSPPSDLKYKGLVELKFESRAHWYLRTIYPVRTILVSWVDPKTVVPRRAEVYIKRQWRLYQDQITFDHERGLALHKISGKKSITVPIPSNVHDSLSLIYYARTLHLKPGENFPVQVTADGKVWQLTAQAKQAGIIRVGRAGYFPAIETEMELAYPIPFFNGANAQIWFSADGNHIPLVIKLKSRFGPVSAVLAKRTVVSEDKNDSEEGK